MPRRSFQSGFSCAAAFAVVAMTGCAHQKTVAYQPPAPPENAHTHYASASPSTPPPSTDLKAEAKAAPRGFFDDATGRPVFTETGLATWYGPNYHRAQANGLQYDQNAMTAAHRTLPMGSTVRVTNLTTGQQVLVRITDRGPFGPGRVLDLSVAAAKAVGVYRVGTAKVKLEAFAHPSPDPAGKWCVQTGAFKSEGQAVGLKSALLERYRGARVIEFSGPTGYWVRIDPAQHGKTQAAEIADWIGTPDPAAVPYLVRLD